MEHINGPKIRDILEKSDYKKLSKEIGAILSKLHNLNITHGDLTTSNMLQNNNDKNKIYLIDFGLSKFSVKVEDKAVDIHLFKQALESKHDTIWEESYKHFIKEYLKNTEYSKEIMVRLDKIELRGRNKQK